MVNRTFIYDLDLIRSKKQMHATFPNAGTELGISSVKSIHLKSVKGALINVLVVFHYVLGVVHNE